jgi:hypothetical protein
MNPEQISPCQNCYALSHTIDGNCGKCGRPKPEHTAEAGKNHEQTVKITRKMVFCGSTIPNFKDFKNIDKIKIIPFNKVT